MAEMNEGDAAGLTGAVAQAAATGHRPQATVDNMEVWGALLRPSRRNKNGALAPAAVGRSPGPSLPSQWGEPNMRSLAGSCVRLVGGHVVEADWSSPDARFRRFHTGAGARDNQDFRPGLAGPVAARRV